MTTKKAKLPCNLGPAQFRPFILKILKKGPLDSFSIVQLAAKEFASQMAAGDLEPVLSGDKKRVKFPHAWQRRLYDSRKTMVESGLLHTVNQLSGKRAWQLTNKGKVSDGGYSK